MGSVYKPTYTKSDKKTGRRVTRKTARWYIEFTDEKDNRRKEPGFTDKTATEQLLREREREVELALVGIVNPFKKHQATPLDDHLDDFEKELRNREDTEGHVKLTVSRIRSILDKSGMIFIQDIAPSKISDVLGGLRRAGRSISTRNHYLRAFKIFTRWLVEDRRTDYDPAGNISMMDPETDRRRVRRPLSPEEFARLLEAAGRGPVIEGMSGPDRAVLYIVASYTGYRRNEIGSVTKRSFNFVADPPSLRVKSTISKRRKEEEIPLRRDVADMIRRWIEDTKADLPEQEPLFPDRGKLTAEMMRADLGGAGLPYVDHDGLVADFHSLRGTFTTNLVIAGVSPKFTQDLARHSDINLTMGVYAKLRKDTHLAEAVEKLPPLPTHRDGQPPQGNSVPDRPWDVPTGEGRPGQAPMPGHEPTIRQLRREASDLGIRGYAKYDKEGLERAIGEARLVGRLVERPGTDGHHTALSGAEGGDEDDEEPQSPERRKSLPDQEEDAAIHELDGGVIEVPKVGLEPTRPCGHRILSPARLPFRHFGKH